VQGAEQIDFAEMLTKAEEVKLFLYIKSGLISGPVD
jgi:hypothetical protein